MESNMDEVERLAIRKWLHPEGISVEGSFVTALETRLSDTGKWLLNSEDFDDWKNSMHGFMWLYGIGELPWEAFEDFTDFGASRMWQNCSLVSETSSNNSRH
jgi:hypothetical protein